MRRPRRRKEEKKKPRRADIQQAECTAVAAAEIIKYLRSATKDNKVRQIRALGKHEIEAIAVAAITAYVTTRQRQETEEEMNFILGNDFADDSEITALI